VTGEIRIEEKEDIGALLVELVDCLDAMVAYWDHEQRCRFANKAYEKWFGRGRQELLGISLRELLGPLYEMNRPHIEAAYRGEKQVFERAIPRLDGNGVRHSLATYLPRLVDGRVAGIFVHVADVEPLKRLEIELKIALDEAERLATHDFLTGLPNRRLLDDRMAEALLRARRSGEPVFALCIDVDRFKSINDVHGHAIGDKLLIEIAARLVSCVRDYDTVARLGGDEFFVLISGPSAGEAIEPLAQRIVEVARRPFEVDRAVLRPSISVGVAQFPRHGATKEELMLASDRALYAAKEAGGDRLCVPQSSP
jgi:diguanylate cyclase (GGDEF)-like protein/PAS domain S-box-containing protein